MQRFKQPNMDLHPDGEWIRYDDHVEAMKRIAGDGVAPSFDCSLASVNAHDPQSFIDGAKWAQQRLAAPPADQVEDALACQTCNGQGEVNHSDEGGFTRDECPTCHGSCLRKDALPEQPPIDNRYVADGCEQFASPAALTDRQIIDLWAESGLSAFTPNWLVLFARKLLAASPADQVGWQPIETAPKDGTEILLFRGAEIFEGKPVAERVTSGAWIELIETASEYHATTGEYLGQSIQGGEASWMSWDGGFREDAPPTHWMPLPPAPVMSASKEGV